MTKYPPSYAPHPLGAHPLSALQLGVRRKSIQVPTVALSVSQPLSSSPVPTESILKYPFLTPRLLLSARRVQVIDQNQPKVCS